MEYQIGKLFAALAAASVVTFLFAQAHDSTCMLGCRGVWEGGGQGGGGGGGDVGNSWSAMMANVYMAELVTHWQPAARLTVLPVCKKQCCSLGTVTKTLELPTSLLLAMLVLHHEWLLGCISIYIQHHAHAACFGC